MRDGQAELRGPEAVWWLLLNLASGPTNQYSGYDQQEHAGYTKQLAVDLSNLVGRGTSPDSLRK